MELGKVSWKRWPWVGFGKMNGNAPGRQGAFHILKSECVTPGVQRKGKDQFLLPCRIAAHDRLSLSGSHNTQLAHGELKPLPFLHCFATSTFIIHASESSFFTKKQKQTLSSFICPSLIADPWFWRPQPCLLRAQCENISILANFPRSFSHISSSETMCPKLCWRQKLPFYKFYRGLDVVSTQLLSSVLWIQSKEKKPKSCLQKSN